MIDSDTDARRLVLEPRPSSASAARRWIRLQLHLVGRDELAEAAELATSELVTNAILHAQTPVTITLEPGPERCRIAIRDQSPSPVAQVEPEPGQVWSSGRGLQILSAMARSWGVDDAPGGKEIWFEPHPFGETNREPVGPDLSGTTRPGVPLRRAQLHQAPVQLLRQARQRFSDLRREMLLITFSVGGQEPGELPRDNQVLPRLLRLTRAIEAVPADLFPGRLARPDRGGLATLSCRFPGAGDSTVTSWPDLLDEADAHCRAGQLLTLAAPLQEALARRWFISELARQSARRQPRPWPDYVEAAS
jgi:anti-sigma regulatory factor (Ser/Thr protein kinase)